MQEPREFDDRAEVSFLGLGVQFALSHVVDHALAQGTDGLGRLCHGTAPVEAVGESHRNPQHRTGLDWQIRYKGGPGRDGGGCAHYRDSGLVLRLIADIGLSLL